MDDTEKIAPLWGAGDQAARLTELTADDLELKEAPLRRDVRSLGRLLGNVIKEQVGNDLFNVVEELRQLAIRHRESTAADDPANNTLTDEHSLTESAGQIVGSLSVTDAYHLTK